MLDMTTLARSIIHTPKLTPTQAAIIDRNKRFADTIRATAQRVPINDAMEILKQQLRDANDRAATAEAVLAEATQRIDDLIHSKQMLEIQISRLVAENDALQKARGINPSIASIVDTVAEHYGTRRELILSNQRYAEIMRPRHVAVYIACQVVTNLSLTEIGRVFKRDHSSMIHARDKIIRAMEADPIFAETVNMLLGKIRGAQ